MEVETGEPDEEYVKQDKWNHWMMTKFMLTNVFGEPNDFIVEKFGKAESSNATHAKGWWPNSES